MKAIRIVGERLASQPWGHDEAERVAEAEPEQHRLILVAGVDHNLAIASDEWMGYLTDDEVQRPFILKGSFLCFGGTEDAAWPTTLGASPLRVEQSFWVRDPGMKRVHLYWIRALLPIE